jgi:formylmethanofuran dehydrogenase subunit E
VKLSRHTGTCAPGRCWVCGWRCWVSRSWGSTTLRTTNQNNKEDRERLVTFVEVDRCATDAIAVVTGCRLGKRALKFRDFGKMVATFVDVKTGPAIRIAAKESSKVLAGRMHPELESKNQQQMIAYREMADDNLFTTQRVKVELPPEEFPGYKGERIVCDLCGEGINFRREVRRDGKILCRSCAGERYYVSS